MDNIHHNIHHALNPTAKEQFENGLSRLIRFDSIRANKLYELSYYSIIAVIIGFYVASLINLIFPKPDDTKNTLAIFIEVVLQVLCIVIGSYYIKHLAKLIPFFPFGDQYEIDKKNESNIGIALGLSILFINTQLGLNKKIIILRDRLYGTSNKKINRC